MKIIAKLFGTLSHPVSGYKHSEGLEIDLPDGSTVADLLSNIGIDNNKSIAVTLNESVVKSNTPLKDGVLVHIVQCVYGG